ncbi:MAG: histidine phosphatase family protein [Candidatus Roizmanbacteria bacterium]|nr:MAG: histidine phosphatase family protein [Candidatus Roizmanbacteria bacterium]
MNDLKEFTTHIWTLRHAPTLFTIQGRLQGTKDVDILPNKTDAYFNKIKIKRLPKPDVIITSSLKRTKQTAKALKKYLNWPKTIPVIKKKNLNERSLGILEIKTHFQVKKLILYGIITVSQPLSYIEKLEDLSEILETPHFKFVGIESMDEVRIRGEKALFEIASLYPNTKIVLINHYAVLKSQGLNPHKICHLIISKDSQGIFHKKITNC